MANKTEVKDLLDAGVHFGHLTRKWNPNMAPYIYMERNGIHVINLYKTVAKLEEANEALKKIAASGRKILFVATKKQAKDIVADKVSKVNMPYITERWPGGMLTNFVTIRKAVKKMTAIDRMKKDGTFDTLSKKEKLQVNRLRAKLEKNLGSIADMTRLPGAIFIVDTMREHIAVKEALKLNIPIFAMVDTNSDPRPIDFIIPSNDDAGKSIEIIMEQVTAAIGEGLAERKAEKGQSEKEAAKEDKKEEKKAAKEAVAKKADALEKEEEEAPTPKTKEAPKAKKTTSNPDDLTKVEGIGPKAAEALVAANISTYADLAKADAENVKTILTEASPRLAHLDPTSWGKQATMAAEGKWDELKEWQDSVKGGVEDSEE
ncbi:30S ribosomal protein S2 [Croceivirga thetidis]|uniref:Small ribosomal subunit protein uS2 n=1 Tax=Croceivirga thetidis TaxID=2721623 RepID=A0ABX1GLD6_9FLAO|nr:30S ribosomal protein S2 [Croceivirga thetidis]NKI30669.1 30S ribosomal protein S2 [Croceivirga thetidis]